MKKVNKLKKEGQKCVADGTCFGIAGKMKVSSIQSGKKAKISYRHWVKLRHVQCTYNLQ